MSDFMAAFERERELCQAWFQDAPTDAERDWLREHFELAGARVPDVDISWIQMERG